MIIKEQIKPWLGSSLLLMPVLGMLVLLGLKMCAPVEKGRSILTASEGTPPRKARPRTIAEPVVGNAWERPAYILQGDRALVDMPGLGYVEGRALLGYTFKLEEGGKPMRAEIVVVDDDGNFMYVRGRPPYYKSKRDLKVYWERQMKESQKYAEACGAQLLGLTVLGPAKLKFDSPRVQESLAGRAILDWPETGRKVEYESWGLRYHISISAGPQLPAVDEVHDVILDSAGGGSSSEGKLLPKFHPKYYNASRLDGSFSYLGELMLYEEWLEVPPQFATENPLPAPVPPNKK